MTREEIEFLAHTEMFSGFSVALLAHDAEQRAEIARLTKELDARPTREWEHSLPMSLRGMNKEIERLKAQLATANERVTRMRSLLQRAQSIITLDADLYTIWREDAVEELAK